MKFLLSLVCIFALTIKLALGQTENSPALQIDRPAIFDSKPYAELGASYEGLTNGYAPWQSQDFD